MFYATPSHRPEQFQLNSASPLCRGLVLAGLGNHRGAVLYHDDSPSRFHGTLTGYSGAGDRPADRWRWDGCLKRWVLGFDGSDDYVAMPSINVTGQITVACWLNVGNSSQAGVIDHLHNGGSFEGYSWKVNFSTYPHKMSWYSGGGWKHSDTAVDDGTWHHVAFVGDTAYNFFLDGKADGSVASFSNASSWSGGGQLGKSYDGYLAAMSLGDPFIWNRPLPTSAIAALADPGNLDLRISGVPLILPVRRFWPASTANPRRRRLLCGA